MKSSAAGRWLLLLPISALLAFQFEALRIPAALLLGPLVAAAALAALGRASVVPVPMFRLAHAVLGVIIAQSLVLGTLTELLHDWPIFLVGTVSVVAASTGIGWALARWRVLPGTTAVWGAAPGAASAMIVMAGSFGADMRLVAFMQYLRVFFAVVIATLVAGYWAGQSPTSAHGIDWFAPLHLGPLASTLAVILGGAALALRVRFPASSMLVPLLLATVLSNAGLVTIDLPAWLLAPTYAVVGWQVGSRFDRPILRHALRALPSLVAGVLALLGLSAGMAAVLVAMAEVDPLTAYLATSPGGIDSIAIIGMAGGADMSFVMAMQMARFLLVLVAGPWIARAVARSMAGRA